MQDKHILIYGERGSGKTTMIEKLLRVNRRPVYGFCTWMTPRREDGYHSIYMHPAHDTRREKRTENYIGDCNSRERTVHSEVFETMGVECLKHSTDGLIVMDELGFMEKDAKAFCAAVNQCFDGDTPVLAVCKARFDVDFLNALRAHPKVRPIELTIENRDAVFEELLGVIEKWNKEKPVEE